MAEEIGFENGRNSNFQGLVTLTLTGHTAYRRVSLIDLYLHTKFHSNRRNFLWTDGRTDVRTDGHFSPLILLGRLLEVDLKITHTRDRLKSSKNYKTVTVTWLMLTPAANLSLSWTPGFGKPTHVANSCLLHWVGIMQHKQYTLLYIKVNQKSGWALLIIYQIIVNNYISRYQIPCVEWVTWNSYKINK